MLSNSSVNNFTVSSDVRSPKQDRGSILDDQTDFSEKILDGLSGRWKRKRKSRQRVFSVNT